MIVAFTTLRVRPDAIATFEAKCSEFFALIRQHEPGTIFYTITRSRDELGLYRGVEVYKDQAAQDAHNSASYFGEVGGALMACLEGPPSFVTHDSID